MMQVWLFLPMVFLGRGRSAAEDPWLEWKVRIFAAGAAFAIGGMVLGIDWLVTVAIVVLIGGFALRFLPVAREDADDEEA